MLIENIVKGLERIYDDYAMHRTMDKWQVKQLADTARTISQSLQKLKQSYENRRNQLEQYLLNYVDEENVIETMEYESITKFIRELEEILK